MASGNTIGTAYVQIIPTTEGIQGELEKTLGGEATSAGKSVGGKFGSALGAAAKVGIGATVAMGTAVAGTGVAITNSAKAVAEYGDNIDKMSQKLGVSSDFYQEWEAVLQHSGTSMEGMTSTFKTLSKASQDTTKSQAAAFESLGMSLEDISKMSTEDLFTNVITKLQGMEEGTERTAIASTLLGRGAMEMGALLNTSAADTQNMIDTVHQLGGVLDSEAVKSAAGFQDQLQDMTTAFDGVKNKASASLLPAMTDIMKGFTDVITGTEGADAEIKSGVEGIVTAIQSAMPALKEIIGSIGSALIEIAPDVLSSLAEGIITCMPELAQTATDILTGLCDFLIQAAPGLLEAATVMISTLATNIGEQLPTLIPQATQMIVTMVTGLLDNIDLLVDAAIALITGLSEGIANALPILIEQSPVIIEKFVLAMIENFPKLMVIGPKMMLTLATGLIQALPSLLAQIPGMVMRIAQAYIAKVGEFIKVGKDIVDGIWQGIKNNWEGLCSKAKNLAQRLVDSIKGFFNIGSPSRVFRDEVGKWIPEGVAVGINATADSPIKALGSMADDMTGTLQSQIASDVSLSPVYSASSLEVANSDTQGITELMSRYLPQMVNSSVNISLEGDAEGLFNAVRKQNNMFSKANGRSAFA